MTHSEQIWLDQLNTPQRQAVTAGNGPLLVVAGAGSGKTRTLAFRVAYLIANGVLPERILLLTFTRRAADQMLERAKSTVPTGSAKISRVWGVDVPRHGQPAPANLRSPGGSFSRLHHHGYV